MRQKRLSIIISFHTTVEAMKMDRYCMEHAIPGRLIPIPTKITAGCGMAWMARPKERDEICDAMEKGGITFDRIYLLEV